MKRQMCIMKGATRCVLLTKRLAFKVPRLVSWRLFLSGLLANMQEREFARAGWPELCPVLFSLPGGWLVVMPRAAPLNDWQWDQTEAWMNEDSDRDYVLPVELKRDSFGVIGSRIVAVDYGS